MPWPGNAASPWIRIGSVRSGSKTGLPGWSASVPAARAMPSTTGLTNSRWLGLGAIETLRVGVELPQGAGVVLHVAGPAEVDPVAVARQDRVLELREDLRVRLAEDVRQHVEAAAMGHADQHVLQAGVVGRRR